MGNVVCNNGPKPLPYWLWKQNIQLQMNYPGSPGLSFVSTNDHSSLPLTLLLFYL